MIFISVEKREHPNWKMFKKYMDEKPILKKLGPTIGQYQYIVKSKGKGAISIIELPNYLVYGITLWEIMAIDGDLFKGIERFKSYEEALRRAKVYLREAPDQT